MVSVYPSGGKTIHRPGMISELLGLSQMVNGTSLFLLLQRHHNPLHLYGSVVVNLSHFCSTTPNATKFRGWVSVLDYYPPSHSRDKPWMLWTTNVENISLEAAHVT